MKLQWIKDLFARKGPMSILHPHETVYRFNYVIEFEGATCEQIRAVPQNNSYNCVGIELPLFTYGFLVSISNYFKQYPDEAEQELSQREEKELDYMLKDFRKHGLNPVVKSREVINMTEKYG